MISYPERLALDQLSESQMRRALEALLDDTPNEGSYWLREEIWLAIENNA